MESQLAYAVHASWPLWLIATFFLVLPTPSYIPFAAYLAVMALLLLVSQGKCQLDLRDRKEEPASLVLLRCCEGEERCRQGWPIRSIRGPCIAYS
jgi:hypothetical protein